MFRNSNPFQAYLLITIVLAAAGLHTVPLIQLESAVASSDNVSNAQDGELNLNCTPGYPCIPEEESAVAGSDNVSNAQDGELNLNCTPGYPCIPED
jgi:hypothetical protein